jgi:hypothetical protein
MKTCALQVPVGHEFQMKAARQLLEDLVRLEMITYHPEVREFTEDGVVNLVFVCPEESIPLAMKAWEDTDGGEATRVVLPGKAQQAVLIDLARESGLYVVVDGAVLVISGPTGSLEPFLRKVLEYAEARVAAAQPSPLAERVTVGEA